MIRIAEWIKACFARKRRGRRQRMALRELEKLDQAALNDVGLCRGALVTVTHGHRDGQCAAY